MVGAFASAPTGRPSRISSGGWRQIAEGRGWEVVKEYDDAGIGGSKGRSDRPGLDEMLKDAAFV